MQLLRATFTYLDDAGNEDTVQASFNDGTYQQWGAGRDMISANQPIVAAIVETARDEKLLGLGDGE